MPLLHFIVSIAVYVGGGCALVYYSQDQWWQLYALVAWFGFWMAGLRGMILALRGIMINLADGIKNVAEVYLAEDKD